MNSLFKLFIFISAKIFNSEILHYSDATKCSSNLATCKSQSHINLIVDIFEGNKEKVEFEDENGHKIILEIHTSGPEIHFPLMNTNIYINNHITEYTILKNSCASPNNCNDIFYPINNTLVNVKQK
ncbi:hypothetical protein MXB_182, partial [Myxobolus squamalis]